MDATADEPEEKAGRWRPTGWGGCGLWAFAFFAVVIGGCAVGLVLRPDQNAETKPATAEAGDGWLLQVNKDETKAPCTQLVDDKQVLLAGQCSFGIQVADGKRPVYRATSAKVGGQYVIFGPVPEGVARVELHLVDDSTPSVRTGIKNGVRYFVYASDVEDEGPTTLLDKRGKKVTP